MIVEYLLLTHLLSHGPFENRDLYSPKTFSTNHERMNIEWQLLCQRITVYVQLAQTLSKSIATRSLVG